MKFILSSAIRNWILLHTSCYILTRIVPSTWIPHPHYNFLCSVDHKNGVKSLIEHLSKKVYIIGNMCKKIQVYWTLTSSKSTSTKKIKPGVRQTDEQTYKQTDEQTRNYNAHKWDIIIHRGKIWNYTSNFRLLP